MTKRLEMKNYNREVFNREAAKISALSSSKIDKNEFLTGEETSASEETKVIEQTKLYTIVLQLYTRT